MRCKDIPEKYAALFAAIDEMKNELIRRRPLTQGELARLKDEFLVEFTYNTNAIDGNSRTGRLMLNRMLMQADYPPINIKFTDRKRYYECFDSYFRSHDATPFVMMVTASREIQLTVRGFH